MPHRAFMLPVVLAFGLLPIGCQSERDQPGTRVEVGDTINYGSVGTRISLDCGAGKSLNVGGTNNTLRVTGRCASVHVGGADNTLTVDRIDGELAVVGLNNAVSYREGDPTISDQGVGTRINRR